MKLPKTLDYQKFIILSECMFESNPLIFIRTDIGSFGSKEELKRRYTKGEVTITSIEVRLPQFSIGDTVMIVDTGEIAKIYKEDDIKMEAINESNNMFFVGSHNENEFYGYFHPSQLIKIPTDLLPILQD